MASNPVPREGEGKKSTREPEERRTVQSGGSETEGGTMRENSGPHEAQCSDEEEEYLCSGDEEDEAVCSNEEDDSQCSDEEDDSTCSDEEDGSKCSDEEDGSKCSDEEDDSKCSDEEDGSKCSDEEDDSKCSDEEDGSKCSDEEDDSLCSGDEEESLYNDEEDDSQCSDEEDDSKCNDEEPVFLNLADLQTQLHSLQMKLPDEVPSGLVVELSSNVAVTFARDLKKSKLKSYTNPCLSSREIKDSLILKENEDVRELARVLFLKESKTKEKSTEELWKAIETKYNGRLKVTDLRGKQLEGKLRIIHKTKRMKTVGTSSSFKGKDRRLRRVDGQMVGFGIFSGSSGCLAEVKTSTESGSSQTERIGIECERNSNSNPPLHPDQV